MTPRQLNITMEWVLRLESGEITEGGFCLKAKWGLSPLGVLCEIWLDHHGRTWHNAPKEWEHGRSLAVPTIACEWAGVPLPLAVEVTLKNDRKDFSFGRLAKLIRKKLLTENHPIGWLEGEGIR